MNCCNKLKEIYEGKQIKDIPELLGHIEEITTDFKKWLTTYKCTRCGQLWLERYIEKGHGEVPEVVKASNENK